MLICFAALEASHALVESRWAGELLSPACKESFNLAECELKEGRGLGPNPHVHSPLFAGYDLEGRVRQRI